MALAQRHCPARLGMQWDGGGGVHRGTKERRRAFTDWGHTGLESLIMESPVLLQQKAPHRLIKPAPFTAPHHF